MYILNKYPFFFFFCTFWTSTHFNIFHLLLAQLAWGVEYADCMSAENKTPSNECSWYDTKPSDNEAPVILVLRGMWSTPSLPSFPGPLWAGLVAPDRVLSMGQIEVFDI